MALTFPLIEVAGPRRMFATTKESNLSHGYLFTGPVGVGKRTFAHALGQSLLCEAERHSFVGYCGVCTNCNLVKARTHPDLLIHEGELKIGDRDGAKDEGLNVRELVRALSLRGYGSARRIVVLGEVSFATHHAANAILKFFEEPPAGVHLFLTTSTPGKILPTIRSRLVEVVFSPLSTAGIHSLLIAHGVSPEQAQQVAPNSQGSFTRALSLLESAGLRADVATWFFDALARQPADAVWATRATLAEGLEIVSALLRDWLVLSVDPERPLPSGEHKRLKQLPLSTHGPLAAMAAFDESRRLATTNVLPALIIDGLRLALGQCLE